MPIVPILTEIRACTTCALYLPHGVRPLLAASPKSRILLIGQAPGRVAHASGIPWSDRSGDRLREWLGISNETFYDADKVAIVPMGFCYPGTGKQGDLPPRPECAPQWHPLLLPQLRNIKLTIYLGRYAWEHHLGNEYPGLTEAAADFANLLPTRIVLPHPSPRNQMWIKRNPWFPAGLLPSLQKRVRKTLEP